MGHLAYANRTHVVPGLLEKFDDEDNLLRPDPLADVPRTPGVPGLLEDSEDEDELLDDATTKSGIQTGSLADAPISHA